MARPHHPEIPKNRILQRLNEVDTDFTMMTDENSDSPSDRVPSENEEQEIASTEAFDYGEMNEEDAIISGYVAPNGAGTDLDRG